MRIPLSCLECIDFETVESPRSVKPGDGFMADMDDLGIYRGECSRGHALVCVLQNHKYEVLYQSGALAFLYGFHREAVASAATALERFYEHLCFVFWGQLGVSKEVAHAAWTSLKRSERETGAMEALYAVAMGDAFIPRTFKIPSDLPQRRNQVVHAGWIPKQGDARRFLQEIYEIIELVTDQVRARCADAWDQTNLTMIFDRHRRARELVKDQNVSGMAYDFMVSRMSTGVSRAFDDRLAILRSVAQFYVEPPGGYVTAATVKHQQGPEPFALD